MFTYEEEMLVKRNRAYELLGRIHENNYIITPAVQREIEELYKPEWLKELENES